MRAALPPVVILGRWMLAGAVLASTGPVLAQDSAPSGIAPVPSSGLSSGTSSGTSSAGLLGGGAGLGLVTPGLGLGAYPFGPVPAASAPGPVPPWSITPSLGVTFLGTDNVRNTARNRRGDLVTTIAPGIAAAADTARLSGRLSYTPGFVFYADTPGQDRVDHRVSGQVLATLVEDRFFLDLRAFGGLQSITGGFAPEGSPVVDRNNQTQTISLQASPYLLHRFGGLGSARIGYGLRYLSQDGRATTLPGSTQPFFAVQETTTHEGYAVFRTGEDFGRLTLEQRANAIVFDSDNAALDGAQRITTALQLRYSLTREFAAFVEGGYQEQQYGGTRPVDISGAVWAVGFRLTPDPDSVILFRYGRDDGFEAARLNASFNVGVRTRIFATYSDQLGTPALLGGDLLSTATVDALGNPVDSASGAPVLLPFGGSLLATQTNVQRLKRATLGISQLWERDSVSLFASYDDRSPVTAAPGTTSFPQKGWSVGFTWGRSLTPNLTGNLALIYGRTESSGGGTVAAGSSDIFRLSAGLARELAPGLFSNLQYSFSDRGNSQVSDRIAQNIVILSLRQIF